MKYVVVIVSHQFNTKDASLRIVFEAWRSEHVGARLRNTDL